jgi:2'-hydroxyisoflavone reductase
MKTKNLHKSRRKFLQTSIKAGFALPLMTTPAIAKGIDDLSTKRTNKSDPSKSLKILILGGTSFLGPHQIAYAIERGHAVTMFTRGRRKPIIHQEYFKDVEALVGDREDNLEALKGRQWDVVIDNSGHKVQWTKDTAELLKDSADMYLYTSSISVLFPFTGTDFSEKRKLVLENPAPDVYESNKMEYDYGIMKANSELAAINAFGAERATIVRPHLIVGPADPTNRFNYWPVRLAQGGEVLLPGKSDDPLQYIDVRDLAQWMIRLLENEVSGTFNASGPGFAMTMPQFVFGAHAAFNSPISYVQIDDYDFLSKHNASYASPWAAPTGLYAGMLRSDNRKAIANGLTFTPLAKTVIDSYNWWQTDAITDERRSKMKNESLMAREKDIIAAWKSK